MTDAIKKRYDAFWARQNTDRAILNIYTESQPRNHEYESLYEQWESWDRRRQDMENLLRHNTYYAEGFPSAWPNFGPGSLAAMIGTTFTFSKLTVWFGENFTLLDDWANIDKIKLYDDGRMYELAMQLTQHFCEHSKGRYEVALTDLGGNLDILASLRGTNELLLDIYDNPEMITKSVSIIDDLWEEMYTRLYKLITSYGQEGTVAWIPLWCRQRWYPLQCDFSAMISPDDFARFVVPSLTRASEFLDHSIYHWDGPGEIPHLPHLLSIPSLDGIQWTPGDGNPPVHDDKWFPLYEQIQAAGKNLVLFGESGAEGILKIMKNLKPEGLFISAKLDSKEAAEELTAYTRRNV